MSSLSKSFVSRPSSPILARRIRLADFSSSRRRSLGDAIWHRSLSRRTYVSNPAINVAIDSGASSISIRLLRAIGLALICIPAGFAMATVPVVPAINGLLNPPTDAETLAMFEPYDERSREIDSHIMGHPIAQKLRRDPDLIESRPFMKLPPEAQTHHLTSGALGGRGKLWVPPLQFSHKHGDSAATLLYLGQDICGHPGIVHGGMLATLLDEGLARCCFPALPHKVGMTATLTVDYKAPTPANTFVILRASTTKVEGRKAWVEGRIESLDTEEGQEPVIFASARGLFVEPKQAATMAKLYPVASG